MSLHSSSTIHKNLSSHFKVGYELRSRQRDLSSPIVLQLGIRTAKKLHDNDTFLPRIKFNYDFFHKLPLQFDYIQDNPINNSKLELLVGISHQALSLKAMISRKISDFAHFSIGLRHLSWEGISWVFQYQQGDVCLDIPIRLFSPYSNNIYSILYAVRCAYIGILCKTIQSVIGELLDESNRNVSGLKDFMFSQQNELLNEVSKKKKNIAEQQQLLMKRKAESNRRVEEEKDGGLIVENAIYGIDGGESFDVTVVLQFWVSDSRLFLPGNCYSYCSMLGFYDVPSTYRNQENDTLDQASIFSRWKMILLLVDKLKAPDGTDFDRAHPNPYLDVRYRFNEKCYYTRIIGDETLSLPSPRSIEVENL